MMAWDVTLTQALAGQGVDLAVVLTLLGEPLLAFPILIVTMVALHRRKGALKTVRRLLTSGVLLLVVVQGAKRSIDRPRPAAQLDALRSLPGGHLRQHAFPSGHSALAAFVGGAIAVSPIATAGRVVAVGLAVGVGWSRVAIGAHWVSDVLIGLLLGFGLAFKALRGHPRVVEVSPEERVV